MLITFVLVRVIFIWATFNLFFNKEFKSSTGCISFILLIPVGFFDFLLSLGILISHNPVPFAEIYLWWPGIATLAGAVYRAVKKEGKESLNEGNE